MAVARLVLQALACVTFGGGMIPHAGRLSQAPILKFPFMMPRTLRVNALSAPPAESTAGPPRHRS